MKIVYRAIPMFMFTVLAACAQQQPASQTKLTASEYISKMGDPEVTDEDIELVTTVSAAVTYYRLCAIGSGKADYSADVAKAYRSQGATPRKIRILAPFAKAPKATKESKSTRDKIFLCNRSSATELVSFAEMAERDLTNGDLRRSFILGAGLKRYALGIKSNSN